MRIRTVPRVDRDNMCEAKLHDSMAPAAVLLLLLLACCGGCARADNCLCTPDQGCVVVTCENLPVPYPNALPNMQQLIGSMVVTSAGDVVFPALTQVTVGIAVVENTLVTSLSFPSLASVGSSIQIERNPMLNSVSFPMLADVGYSFDFENNPALTSMSFPALASVSNYFYIGFSTQKTMSFPSLATVGGDFQISYSSALTSVSFPSLNSVLSISICDYCSLCTLAEAMPAVQLDPLNDQSPFNSSADWRYFGEGCAINAHNTACDSCVVSSTMPTVKLVLEIAGVICIACSGVVCLGLIGFALNKRRAGYTSINSHSPQG